MELGGHYRSDCFQTGFRYAVSGLARKEHGAETGRHVDDSSPTRRNHLGSDQTGEPHGRESIDLQETAVIVIRDRPKLDRIFPKIRPDGSRSDACIVEKNVDAAECALRRIDKP